MLRVPEGKRGLAFDVLRLLARVVFRGGDRANGNSDLGMKGTDMKVTLSTSQGTQDLNGTVMVTALPTPVPQVTSVRFYVEDVLKATDTSSPFTYSWDTTTVADGSYQLKAQVTYSRNQIMETKLDVTVDNTPEPPLPPPPSPPPVNTSAPVIQGTATEGQTLTVDEGVWSNSPTGYRYQWTSCDAGGVNCNLIPTATSKSYLLVTADVGRTIRCVVVAYNDSGDGASATSAQTAVVAGTAAAVPAIITYPILQGQATQGSTLSCSTGTWTNQPTNYVLAWQRCDASGIDTTCADVAGTDSSTYVLTSADVGRIVRCVVKAQNTTGDSIRQPSNMTAVVSAPPAVSSWLPSPPASYVGTGTFVKSVVVGTNPVGYGQFFTSRQFCVRTGTGITFLIYNPVDSDSHLPAYWRLLRSNDGGTSWTTVRDSQQTGDPNCGGGVPGLEIDQNDNVYIVVSQYKSAAPNNIFRVFKYIKADNYANPPSTRIFNLTGLVAANKWACVWDQTRDWLWIVTWEQGTAVGTADLMAIDTTGAIKVQKQIFGPLASNFLTSRHAQVVYVFATVLLDGTLVISWSGESGYILGGGVNAFQSYFDVQFVYSTDGGQTFYGPASGVSGAPAAIQGTVIGDDTATSGRRAYRVCDFTAGVEFISPSDPNYYPNGTDKYNYNLLAAFTYNSNALHFFYQGVSTANVVGTLHRPHVRFDWSSKAVNLRNGVGSPPVFGATSGTATTVSNSAGVFVQDTTLAGRLYFIAAGSNNDAGKIVVLKSDDGGTTWTRYAASANIGSTPYWAGACRWVQSDGSILAYAQQLLSPYQLYFFQINPAI